MDKIIWLDGHTSSIASDGDFSKQYSENNKWYMNHADSTFVWMANCWMEISQSNILRIINGTYIKYSF